MTDSGLVIETAIAPGELLDKLSILQIKLDRIGDAEKLKNVQIEHDILQTIKDKELPTTEALSTLFSRLKEINESLWVIEDDIRDCERDQDFSDTFIQLARSVYKTNDVRAAIKKEINVLLGSDIVEEKSYQPY